MPAVSRFPGWLAVTDQAPGRYQIPTRSTTRRCLLSELPLNHYAAHLPTRAPILLDWVTHYERRTAVLCTGTRGLRLFSITGSRQPPSADWQSSRQPTGHIADPGLPCQPHSMPGAASKSSGAGGRLCTCWPEMNPVPCRKWRPPWLASGVPRSPIGRSDRHAGRDIGVEHPVRCDVEPGPWRAGGRAERRLPARCPWPSVRKPTVPHAVPWERLHKRVPQHTRKSGPGARHRRPRGSRALGARPGMAEVHGYAQVARRSVVVRISAR